MNKSERKQDKLNKLVIKDMCNRMPYNNLKVAVVDANEQVTDIYEVKFNHEFCAVYNKQGTYRRMESVMADISHVKPLLIPMDALTPEQCDEIYRLVVAEGEEGSDDWLKFRRDGDIWLTCRNRSLLEVQAMFDWLYAHDYDVNGLLAKGAALDKRQYIL